MFYGYVGTINRGLWTLLMGLLDVGCLLRRIKTDRKPPCLYQREFIKCVSYFCFQLLSEVKLIITSLSVVFSSPFLSLLWLPFPRQFFLSLLVFFGFLFLLSFFVVLFSPLFIFSSFFIARFSLFFRLVSSSAFFRLFPAFLFLFSSFSSCFFCFFPFFPLFSWLHCHLVLRRIFVVIFRQFCLVSLSSRPVFITFCYRSFSSSFFGPFS